MLKGKRILVTGVLNDGVDRVLGRAPHAQEQGAEVVLSSSGGSCASRSGPQSGSRSNPGDRGVRREQPG